MHIVFDEQHFLKLSHKFIRKKINKISVFWKKFLFKIYEFACLLTVRYFSNLLPLRSSAILTLSVSVGVNASDAIFKGDGQRHSIFLNMLIEINVFPPKA